MNNIIGILWDNRIGNCFSLEQLRPYYKSNDSLYSAVKRAVKDKSIYRLKHNLYCINPKYAKKDFSLESLIPVIDDTAYVSDYSALSYNNWVLDYVPNLFVTSQKKERTINVCHTIYFKRIEQKNWKAGTFISDRWGTCFPEAKPLKAVCDFIINSNFTREHFDRGILHWFEYSERTEIEFLEELKDEDFNELVGNYPKYPIADWFLEKLHKELSDFRISGNDYWRTQKLR